MKKHPVNPSEISTQIVWLYRLENRNDFLRKTVLSRRYMDEFVNIFDELRVRNVQLIGNYNKPLHRKIG